MRLVRKTGQFCEIKVYKTYITINSGQKWTKFPVTIICTFYFSIKKNTCYNMQLIKNRSLLFNSRKSLYPEQKKRFISIKNLKKKHLILDNSSKYLSIWFLIFLIKMISNNNHFFPKVKLFIFVHFLIQYGKTCPIRTFFIIDS